MDTTHNTHVHTSGGFRAVSTVALVLLIIGGLNWGLVGLFDFDLVATLFGPMSPLSRIVYVLVGASAVVSIATLTRINKH